MVDEQPKGGRDGGMKEKLRDFVIALDQAVNHSTFTVLVNLMFAAIAFLLCIASCVWFASNMWERFT